MEMIAYTRGREAQTSGKSDMWGCQPSNDLLSISLFTRTIFLTTLEQMGNESKD